MSSEGTQATDPVNMSSEGTQSLSSASGGASATVNSHLQYIMTDSTQNVRHSVPPGKKGGGVHKRRAGGSDNNNKRSPSNDSSRHQEWKDKASSKTYRLICGENADERTALDWAGIFLPCVKWLRTYPWKASLPTDLIAGLTVGVMIIPQSMSYAKLAGLPVQFGLYSGLVPVYAYALFGSSRQLAVGPVALLSLMLSTGLTHIVGTPENENQQLQYNMLAIQAAFLMGVAYIVMGLLRLGFVTIFLSHAVVSGFTSGAAVIIGMSQIKYIFGYDVERSDVLPEILHSLFSHIDEFNWKTFLMGSLSIFALVSMKFVGKTYARFKWVRAIGPLTVSAFCILLTWAGNLDEKGIAIVGSIPRGLPSFSAQWWFPLDSRLIPTVLSMVVVGFMESIAIAKQLAAKHKYELDSSLELIGLGAANMAGAMFMSYPVTGSFSRSAVNNEAGATSGISAVVTATLIVLVLLFLTPVFELMPLATLAAIVISGVLGLLDYPEAIYLWKVHKFDFLVWMLAFLGTMFLGVEIGLGIAVVVSLLLVLYESAYPHTATLGRLPGSTVYRNVKQYPEAEVYDGLVVCRIDAPIYFANTQHIREKLQKYELQAQSKSTRAIRYVIIDLSPVSHVDTTALHILQDINSDYISRHVQLCLSNPSRNVMERLVTSGLVEKIGHDHIFVSVHDAVTSCLQKLSESPLDSDGFGAEEEGRRSGGPPGQVNVVASTVAISIEDEMPGIPEDGRTEEEEQQAGGGGCVVS